MTYAWSDFRIVSLRQKLTAQSVQQPDLQNAPVPYKETDVFLIYA